MSAAVNEGNSLRKSYSTQSAKWWFSDHKILNTLQDERGSKVPTVVQVKIVFWVMPPQKPKTFTPFLCIVFKVSGYW